jgi:hypothetical protein
MEDFSFIKLYKNDFASALNADSPAISTLKYKGFITQRPDETFLQITNTSDGIAFVGGITVELVDNCNRFVLNIDDNFFYTTVTDSNGNRQMIFEFGYLGTDFWTKPLHLKITDNTNLNVWYSNSFLVTYYMTNISSRFDYYNPTKIFGISYDLAPFYQSIRIANCYDNNAVNTKELKQYVTSQGLKVNYRNIVSFLRSYLIESLDYFVNDRLEVLFSHAIVYLNNERVVVNDYKVDERKGDTNFMGGEFVINKQNEKFIYSNQIFPDLMLTSKSPLGIYTSQVPNVGVYGNTYSEVYN